MKRAIREKIPKGGEVKTNIRFFYFVHKKFDPALTLGLPKAISATHLFRIAEGLDPVLTLHWLRQLALRACAKLVRG